MIPVKIKSDKYGSAISLLINMGGGFETRIEDTLIVSKHQKLILETAGFVKNDDSVDSASTIDPVKLPKSSKTSEVCRPAK